MQGCWILQMRVTKSHLVNGHWLLVTGCPARGGGCALTRKSQECVWSDKIRLWFVFMELDCTEYSGLLFLLGLLVLLVPGWGQGMDDYYYVVCTTVSTTVSTTVRSCPLYLPEPWGRLYIYTATSETQHSGFGAAVWAFSQGELKELRHVRQRVGGGETYFQGYQLWGQERPKSLRRQSTDEDTDEGTVHLDRPIDELWSMVKIYNNLTKIYQSR